MNDEDRKKIRPPESFTTSSRELAREFRSQYLSSEGEMLDNDVLRVVTWRAGDEEFNLAKEYLASADPLNRITGALILSQFGWDAGGARIEESVDLLLPLLNEEDIRVVSNVAFALGHRGDPRAVPGLVALEGHPDENVRSGVVFGLLTQKDPQAISCLIRLAKDPVDYIRDWAVFGLGSQIDEIDTPEIRQALFEALDDENEDVWAEATVGLAERGDDRMVPGLLKYWEECDPYGVCIEAAYLIGDVRLIPPLEALLEKMDGGPDSEWFREEPDRIKKLTSWRKSVVEALRRCRGEIDRFGDPVPPAISHRDPHD